MPWHPQGLDYLGFADPAGTCWDCPPWPQPTWACRNALGASGFPFSLPKARSIPCRTTLKALLPTPGDAPGEQGQSLPSSLGDRASNSRPVCCAAAPHQPLHHLIRLHSPGCLGMCLCSTPDHRFPSLVSPRHQQGFAKAKTLPQVLCSPCPAACRCLYVSFLVFRLSGLCVSA